MADFAAFDILGSSPSDAGRTPSPHSWSSYSPPGSVESMLNVPDFAPPPPAVFFHQHHQHHQSSHQDLYNGSTYWPGAHSSLSAAGPVPLPSRSFLGGDLYDDKEQAHASSHLKSHDGMYISPPGSVFRADWELGGSVGNSSAESSPSVHNLAAPPTASPAPSAGAQDAQPYYRRSSYPYARHDEPIYHSSPRDGPVYAEPLPIEHSQQPLAADPAHLHARPLEESQYVQAHHQHSHHNHHHNPHHQPQHHHHAHAAHTHAHQHPDEVKIENSNGMAAHQYYRPQHQQSAPTGPPQSQAIPPPSATTYMTHAGGIPIMHTDDAASKETQYLRRRCFNCHTTEPPSWRRSTLNPGKIVCNKCGLYERTHLRPRPHRFDELRATSKARKAASKGSAPSPQQSMQHHMIPHQPQPQLPQAISQQQVPQHVPSPSLSPKSQQGGYVKKEPGEEYDMRRASVGSVGSSNVNVNGEWDTSVSGHRLSQSPPSSHAAGPIRLPSLPGGSMGSRTPEAQRPYFDRRSSMPVTLDGSRVDTPPPQQQSPQQWQTQTMSVADLVDDDKSRTPN
ncbi:hypothetical protein BKA62DRAFT_669114 [Auriculariales sp. MPI-PUGE-AT-0066]|nr:hypothetical protein BKA62DRAFT_669114 [Auriculariales sp. MPI-PUGE-AT-0066]